MALGFNEANGSAVKSSVSYMKLVEGDNTFRILPNSLLPSYTYWVKGANGKEFPFECLQFNRNTEKFDNSISDPIKVLDLKDPTNKDKNTGAPLPLRCSWSYKCLVLNKATGKVEVLQLKKGILEEIKSVSKQLEIDPTSYETGTWFTVTRKKTGPMAFNVEYSVQQLKCKSTAVTDEEKSLMEESKSIDEMFELESYEDQMARLRKHLEGSRGEAEASGNDNQEAIDELS